MLLRMWKRLFRAKRFIVWLLSIDDSEDDLARTWPESPRSNASRTGQRQNSLWLGPKLTSIDQPAAHFELLRSGCTMK